MGMTDRNPDRLIQLVLDDMDVEKDEVDASILSSNIYDGTETYIVTVLQFDFDHARNVSTHTLTRYVIHYVDDFITYKRLGQDVFHDTDLMDGTFRYRDEDHELRTGSITWDRSDDPYADPTVIEDES